MKKLIVCFVIVLNNFQGLNAQTQTLDVGYNYFIYTSNLNRVLFQEIKNRNDSILEVKSTIIRIKDSVDFQEINFNQKKDLFSNINSLIELDTERVILFDTLHYLFRPNIKKTSILISWKRGEYIVDFNSSKIDSTNNYIFDVRSFYAKKRYFNNSIAEFENIYGLFNFRRFIFIKNFWVIKYFSEHPYAEDFTLIEFNNNKFDSKAILKTIESK